MCMLMFMLPVFSYVSIMSNVRGGHLYLVAGTQSVLRMTINLDGNEMTLPEDRR